MNRTCWLLLVIAGCSSEDVVTARKLPAAIQADAAEVVAGNNQLACDIYAKLPAGNTIFSPFSIATAFAMLDAGAAGQTDSELRSAFHFTLPGDQLHAAYAALLTSLDTGRSFGAYTLATADRLFGQQGFAFLPSYLDTTKLDYHAQLEPVDFETNPDAARDTVNQWVASQTDDKIPELFPAGTIDEATRLVLANAIVFAGTWQNQFDPHATHTGNFHVASSADVSTPLMTTTASYSIGDIPGGLLGVIPFQGKDLAMLVLLPADPDGLPALEAQLSGPALAQWVAAAVPTDEPVVLTLPKFTLTLDTSLPAILTALGVTAVFDPSLADLSGIDGSRDLYVARAIHDATITVDEHGAEAAAATGVGATDSAAPASLNVDHSFAYAIYDQVTGSVLFMGRVQDPTQM